MEADRQIQIITPILRYYGARPYFAETYGKVRKVYTDKGTFALKQISPHSGTDFVKYIQHIYQQGFNRIVPIYPTLDGRYAVLHNGHLYYLMPWLSNESKDNKRHYGMFRELARLHSISTREVTINKEEKQEYYDKTKLEWEKDEEFINGFILACEQKTYMSPFELLFCLYFNDIRQALLFAMDRFNSWHDHTKDDEKARVVMTHGKLSTDHFVLDERGYGYFVNLEKSHYASPLHDLLPFLSETLHTYPYQHEECIEWFYTYAKFFPLRESEMTLFLSYLAYPGAIIRKVENFFHKKNKNERKAVIELQKEYWHLKSCEYVVTRINEIERQKQQEKEAMEQSE